MLDPEIEGGYPERGGEGEEEGLVLEYPRSWITIKMTACHDFDGGAIVIEQQFVGGYCDQ